jgi:hypothetical protein
MQLNSAGNEGANDAKTLSPSPNKFFTRPTSSRARFAFAGQLTTHFPQKMHILVSTSG